MSKLVEILARELKEWPEGQTKARQDWNREVCFSPGISDDYFSDVLADDYTPSFRMSEDSDYVTRAQWEAERARIAMQGISEFAQEQENAERARIAANQQATQEAREIAKAGTMTNEEQELAAIACGKRSNEDQDLWDKVAVAALQSLTPIMWELSDQYDSGDQLVKCQAESAFDYADAFMAERAKRMKGGE